MAHENTVYIELGKASDNLQNESYEWARWREQKQPGNISSKYTFNTTAITNRNV